MYCTFCEATCGSSYVIIVRVWGSYDQEAISLESWLTEAEGRGRDCVYIRSRVVSIFSLSVVTTMQITGIFGDDREKGVRNDER
jgi:hypothetical protein